MSLYILGIIIRHPEMKPIWLLNPDKFYQYISSRSWHTGKDEFSCSNSTAGTRLDFDVPIKLLGREVE